MIDLFNIEFIDEDKVDFTAMTFISSGDNFIILKKSNRFI